VGFFVCGMIGRFGEMKRILQILPLLFWLGCADNSSNSTGWIHPFAGTWKVTDYCVYESANCDSNCNNQEFIPIFYQAGILMSTYKWSYLSEGRVITIDENGDAGGGINFSQSQQNFTAGSGGYSWESFPGVGGSVPGTTYLSGTCILNDDKNTLELIYNKNAVCISSTSEDWDGSFDGLNGEGIVYSDSIECYDRWIITTHSDFGFTYNDTTYYYYTWFPEYCAKSTLTKQ